LISVLFMFHWSDSETRQRSSLSGSVGIFRSMFSGKQACLNSQEERENT